MLATQINTFDPFRCDPGPSNNPGHGERFFSMWPGLKVYCCHTPVVQYNKTRSVESDAPDVLSTHTNVTREYWILCQRWKLTIVCGHWHKVKLLGSFHDFSRFSGCLVNYYAANCLSVTVVTVLEKKIN